MKIDSEMTQIKDTPAPIILPSKIDNINIFDFQFKKMRVQKGAIVLKLYY